jgi:transposase, IS30 family
MKYKQLTIEEREAIQIGLWQKESIRSIARKLNRSASSISRELKKHQTQIHQQYTPRRAHQEAINSRSKRGRQLRLKSPLIREYVIKNLMSGFSPEQVAGRISLDLPDSSISHEAIYQFIYSQIHRDGYGYTKAGCQDLRHLLKRRHRRRVRKGMRKGQRVSISKGPSINDRPIIVKTRSRVGDWEGDSIASKNNKAGLNSLVDRKSGLLLLTRVINKTAKATTDVVIRRLRSLPKTTKQTLTVDNGSENQDWKSIEAALGIRCFFANPYHSWERGTNENTNGLVRWYFPKGTDFSKVSDEEIARVELALNNRPRKRLNYQTPLEVFTKSVALQG